MRLIHLGDLHLGKFVLEVSMLEEQRAFLRYLADYAAANAVDAVLLAGDIYDRSVPPAEAVQVLDEFWCALHRAGIPVLAVPGNHDSPSGWPSAAVCSPPRGFTWPAPMTAPCRSWSCGMPMGR